MHPSSSYLYGNILPTIDNIKTRKLTLVQSKEFIHISLVLHALNCVYIKLYAILSHV